jgi:hypothetical protein
LKEFLTKKISLCKLSKIMDDNCFMKKKNTQGKSFKNVFWIPGVVNALGLDSTLSGLMLAFLIIHSDSWLGGVKPEKKSHFVRCFIAVFFKSHIITKQCVK